MKSVNPHTGLDISSYEAYSEQKVNFLLLAANQAFNEWKKQSYEQRAKFMRRAAHILRERKIILAELMADEMGKATREGLAEIEKCAVCCEYYADNTAKFLTHEYIESDAAKSYIVFEPLGAVLAVMPWNFPFWQVMRARAASLLRGLSSLCLSMKNSSAAMLKNSVQSALATQGTTDLILVRSHGWIYVMTFTDRWI